MIWDLSYSSEFIVKDDDEVVCFTPVEEATSHLPTRLLDADARTPPPNTKQKPADRQQSKRRSVFRLPRLLKSHSGVLQETLKGSKTTDKSGLTSSTRTALITGHAFDVSPVGRTESKPLEIFRELLHDVVEGDLFEHHSLEDLAADLGVAHVIPHFVSGMNVRVVIRQESNAAVCNARLRLEIEDRPLIFLESQTSTRRRALVIEDGALPSTEPSSTTFLHGAECKPGSESVIRQLVDGYYTAEDGTRKKDVLFFVTVPVRNTYSGHLLFILESKEQVTHLMGVTALIQTYNDVHGNVF